jgi:activating signal cointegrator complex subunit 3
MTEL